MVRINNAITDPFWQGQGGIFPLVPIPFGQGCMLILLLLPIFTLMMTAIITTTLLFNFEND
jgi:hypothetical protein